MEYQLEVYISYVNEHFNATIQGFHQFKIDNSQITSLLANLPQAIKSHVIFCRLHKYNYPDILRKGYKLKYRYSLHATLALVSDLRILSKATKIAYNRLRQYKSYVRKPGGSTIKCIYRGINQIGKDLSTLESANLSLCPNENLLAEYSGISLNDIRAYKSGKVKACSETLKKLLNAMHEIGFFYQTIN